MNILHYGKKKFIEQRMSSYSDDIFEEIPFTCDATLGDVDLSNRLGTALYKKYPPRQFGGCGYSCTVNKVTRTTPTTGVVLIMHYHGIGD